MRTIGMCTVLGVIAVGTLHGQQCPAGRAVYPSIGVGQFHCLGGSCSVNEFAGSGYAHTFSSEPRLRRIDPAGPAAGKLQEGDVLVAVGGALITSREGGRRLGSLRPGEATTLRVRREGRERDVEITPAPSCDLPSLIVARSASDVAEVLEASRVLLEAQRVELDAVPELRSRQALTAAQYAGFGPAEYQTPPVEFGIELSCGDCGWSGGSPVFASVAREQAAPSRRLTTRSWAFLTSEFPVVRAVEKGGPADVAGLQIGDVILTVAGLPITSRQAGEHLGQLEPGVPVDLEVRRGDRIVGIRITPRESTEKRQRW